MSDEQRLDENKDQPGVDRPPSYEPPAVQDIGTVADVTQAFGTRTFIGSNNNNLSSDRSLKREFAQVDTREVLARVAELPVSTWSYTFDSPSVRHMGPMAQDFAAGFGLGDDDRSIHMVDAAGVAIAAIQGLHELVEAQRQELDRLRADVTRLSQGFEIAPAAELSASHV